MRMQGLAALSLSCVLLATPAVRASERDDLLDELDGANARVAVLEIEVEVDKALLKTMLKLLKETGLQELQGFSNGPVIAGKDADERGSRIKKFEMKTDELKTELTARTRDLGRERRRVASLEERTKRNPVLSDDLTKKTIERAIDQLFREFDERKR